MLQTSVGKIQEWMSPSEMVDVVADGNMGAQIVCQQLLLVDALMDPRTPSNYGLASLFMLDQLEIYGERLHILHIHVCKCDISYTIAVLMAYKFGKLAGMSADRFSSAIDSGEPWDLRYIVEAVVDRVPSFNPEALNKTLSGE